MQSRAAVITAASLGVALLAGCAGGMQGTSQSLPATGMAGNQVRAARSGLERSGIAPQFIGHLHFSPVPQIKPAKKGYKGYKDLFVSDFGTNAVELLKNGSYTLDTTITSSVNGPDGDWLDKKGNFYLANYAGPYVTEYAPKSTSVSFTYNSGVSDPVGVATDASGNVYEADYTGGFVNEYAQASNTVLNTCAPGGSVEDVAVDKSGDVFVDFNSANTGLGTIVEYKGGLKGCSGTALGVTLSFAGGMVLDKNNNIVICDQLGPTVDVIAPPYTSVTRTLGSGYGDPFHVTLSKNNKTAFVADVSNAAVYVIDYSSGSITATLNSANGLSDPASAVDGPNFVP